MPSSAVMHKWKTGKLHSGSKSGPKVKSQAQAVAIMLSEKRKESANGGKYPEKAKGGALAVAFKTKRRAYGGATWQEKSEARNLMHTGPVLSSVPGRTDRHPINVPSGSYVMPADHVSALGQGNTLAGVKVLNGMFSKGPYGTGAASMGRGMGLPKPPSIRPPKGLMSDRGGARGNDHGKPTPIIIAGGEYVIPPHIVAQIGGGDITAGHKALDRWVMETRKKHVKTLKGLPPPAKS